MGRQQAAATPLTERGCLGGPVLSPRVPGTHPWPAASSVRSRALLFI